MDVYGRCCRSNSVKILRDINIQCDNVTEARRLDTFVISAEEGVCVIVDIADRKIEDKEKEKVDKYQDLKREIERFWGERKVQVVPIVIGAIRGVDKEFDKRIENLTYHAKSLMCKILQLGKH